MPSSGARPTTTGRPGRRSYRQRAVDRRRRAKAGAVAAAGRPGRRGPCRRRPGRTSSNGRDRRAPAAAAPARTWACDRARSRNRRACRSSSTRRFLLAPSCAARRDVARVQAHDDERRADQLAVFACGIRGVEGAFFDVRRTERPAVLVRPAGLPRRHGVRFRERRDREPGPSDSAGASAAQARVCRAAPAPASVTSRLRVKREPLSATICSISCCAFGDSCSG